MGIIITSVVITNGGQNITNAAGLVLGTKNNKDVSIIRDSDAKLILQGLITRLYGENVVISANQNVTITNTLASFLIQNDNASVQATAVSIQSNTGGGVYSLDNGLHTFEGSSIDLKDLQLLNFPAANFSVDTNSGLATLDYYGTGEAVLTTPLVWLNVVVNDTNYCIPAYVGV